MGRFCLLLVALLVIASGCGGSGSNSAQDQWETREGADWTAFHEGYADGVFQGCEYAKSSIVEKEHAEGNAVVFELLPTCSEVVPDVAPLDRPSIPPDEPRKAGYELGFVAFCEDGLAGYWTKRERAAKYRTGFCELGARP